MTYNLSFRSHEIAYDKDDCRYWKKVERSESYDPSELAIVLVDAWDKHLSKGATMRCGEIYEKADPVVRKARNDGVFIVHGPSDVISFYNDSPARKRALDIEIVKPAAEVKIPDYTLPTDESDGGSDTKDEYKPNTRVWTRQSDKIFIDEDKDIIAEEGELVYSHFVKRGIKRILYMGVHTNMCVLHRPFAIKAMLRRGMQCALVRDLTDCMYNPEKPPYVDHNDGLQLVIGFIEKFYCPTIDSAQLLR